MDSLKFPWWFRKILGWFRKFLRHVPTPHPPPILLNFPNYWIFSDFYWIFQPTFLQMRLYPVSYILTRFSLGTWISYNFTLIIYDDYYIGGRSTVNTDEVWRKSNFWFHHFFHFLKVIFSKFLIIFRTRSAGLIRTR